MKRSVLLACVLGGACAGRLPATHHYQLAPQGAARTPDPDAVTLAIEPLDVDVAYDDERIVYRITPYRLDYYNYHRWSSPPGTLIADFLESALEQSGEFRAVTREDGDAPVTLGGRVLAIEEVDRSKTEWFGHIVIELTLTDTESGELLWAEQFEETEPLQQQSPEGLARALSIAMTRIVARALPDISRTAVQTARARSEPGVRALSSRNRRAGRQPRRAPRTGRTPGRRGGSRSRCCRV